VSEQLNATPVVQTSSPQRYAKQLASHLGRRSEVIEQPAGTLLRLAGGECLLRAQDQALELVASGPTAEDLQRVMNLVGSHLERFGKRNELKVDWEGPVAA
jgi:hypothetical protein